ncbi:hypothetical protein HGO97_007440 [Faecalicatena sp. AGMB00832]|uniref:Lipoprotein n=1 Tax=Faecalicatena faecalis TaxID=2726362 RepID=A0ABS6D224_9FIRM|nr:MULTISPECIES: DUF6612 family protein [Faecalicatena]MBU3875643.1 hypothetical protein [Faecalicatena faecalis]MCI6466908.1 hypothetical protein [Faecalicatena sp.]MDY5617616.1 DUF6612 family protein [Lachnospiraceae bacterium]
MIKYVKKGQSIILLGILCTILTVGCSSKMTPKKMMASVSTNLAKAKSVTNTLRMDIELEDVLDTMKINMDMKMENTVKPKAGHALGSAEVEFGGTKLGSDIEIYQVNEGREAVTYSRMYDKWSREASDNSKKSTFNGNLFQEAGDSIESFRIAEQNVEVDHKECYQMYGNVTGKELLEFMGLDMMGAFGLVEIPDEDAITSLEVPVTIEVYKEDMLPARVIVDMTDVMNELYDKYDKSTNVNDFTIELGYTGFDDVKEILVPQEVKDSCTQVQNMTGQSSDM